MLTFHDNKSCQDTFYITKQSSWLFVRFCQALSYPCVAETQKSGLISSHSHSDERLPSTEQPVLFKVSLLFQTASPEDFCETNYPPSEVTLENKTAISFWATVGKSCILLQEEASGRTIVGRDGLTQTVRIWTTRGVKSNKQQICQEIFKMRWCLVCKSEGETETGEIWSFPLVPVRMHQLELQHPGTQVTNAAFISAGCSQFQQYCAGERRPVFCVLIFIHPFIFYTRLKGNSGIFKPGPYFWHEIRSSTHREQFGESRRPSEDI